VFAPQHLKPDAQHLVMIKFHRCVHG
jgi:hypothetical protein